MDTTTTTQVSASETEHESVNRTGPDRAATPNIGPVSHAFNPQGKFQRFFHNIDDLNRIHHWYSLIVLLVVVAYIAQCIVHARIDPNSSTGRNIAHTINIYGTTFIMTLKQCISYYTRKRVVEASEILILALVAVFTVVGWILESWPSHNALPKAIGLLLWDLTEPALLLGLGYTALVRGNDDRVHEANGYAQV